MGCLMCSSQTIQTKQRAKKKFLNILASHFIKYYINYVSVPTDQFICKT